MIAAVCAPAVIALFEVLGGFAPPLAPISRW
jgi:hypothetical protein